MKKEQMIKKLENANVMIEKIKEFNLLQYDYMDLVNNPVPVASNIKENEINDLLLLHEIRRLNKAHILLNYDISDKLRIIERILDDVTSALIKSNNIN